VRPIHIAQLDKRRPVVVLTREIARQALTNVTIAPITSRVRGLAVEVPVGPRNGLDQPSAVSCDNIQTIPISSLGPIVGYFFSDQELELTEAILAAFDLE
jgi:mRNA interferase MazF